MGRMAVQAPEGIFCHNFLDCQRNLTRCRFASCTSCYQADWELGFPVNRPMSNASNKYRRRKHHLDRFLTARDCDWVFAPFQCDNYWFFNLFQTTPNPYSLDDTRVLKLIRRANLDLFWSRETSTIASNIGKIKKILFWWQNRRGYFPLPEITALEEIDNMGMGAAISMLEHSLEKGRVANYVQFDTCRKIRSDISNVYSATAITLKTTHCRVCLSRDSSMG